MINRLVAENTIKVPFKGQPYFSISKKYIAYQIENFIRVKNLSKQSKDIDIPTLHGALQFALAQNRSWLLLLSSNHCLQIYLVQFLNGISDGSYRKAATFQNVEVFKETKGGIAVITTNRTLKVINFGEIEKQMLANSNLDANILPSLTKLQNDDVLIAYAYSERLFVRRALKEQPLASSQTKTEVYDRVNKGGRYQCSISLSYLEGILGIYRDRYVFQRKQERQVQIYDVNESKLVGKFQIEGGIKFSEVRDNLLFIVNNKENTDYFHFFVLNPQPSSTSPLITNRVIYEKGKGDYYRIFNMQTVEGALLLDKKKNNEITDHCIPKITQSTSSVLYILNKAKQKVQIIKLDHFKLLKSPFGEQKLDMIVYSKKGESSKVTVAQKVQIERSRIHSTMEMQSSERTLQEMQKRFVQNLIDIKLKNVMKKFSELERKVQNLERIISNINEKIQINFEKINKQEIRDNVEKLFDKLTPQFEKYFAEIFKQVAGVLDQGVSYYNMKLAKEADIHKEALSQIVGETFRAAQEIVEIGKREQSISEKTEEHLKKLLETKKKWTQSTQEFESRTREVPSPVQRASVAVSSSPQPEGKVFVRADLNYVSRRQT